MGDTDQTGSNIYALIYTWCFFSSASREGCDNILVSPERCWMHKLFGNFPTMPSRYVGSVRSSEAEFGCSTM